MSLENNRVSTVYKTNPLAYNLRTRQGKAYPLSIRCCFSILAIELRLRRDNASESCLTGSSMIICAWAYVKEACKKTENKLFLWLDQECPFLLNWSRPFWIVPLSSWRKKNNEKLTQNPYITFDSTTLLKNSVDTISAFGVSSQTHENANLEKQVSNQN